MRYLSILFVATLFFVACKKEDNPKDNGDAVLNKYKSRLKIESLTPGVDEIKLTIQNADLLSEIPAGYKVTASYTQTGQTTGMILPVTGSELTITNGIDPNREYLVKLEISSERETVVADQKYTLTVPLTFNVEKMRREDTIYLISGSKIYSWEGTVNKIYGTNFSKLKNLKGQLVERGDTSHKMDVNIDAVNDSTLSFEMPKILADKDYQKQFYLKIGNLYYRESYGGTPYPGTDTMYYNVYSSGIYTDYMRYFPDSTGKGCHTIIFQGHYGVANFNLYSSYVSGIPLRVSQTHLSISNASGEIVGSYDAAISGGAGTCGSVGVNFGWLSYGHVQQLYLFSSLPSGTYTLIVYDVMIDGSKKFSNQFQFTF